MKPGSKSPVSDNTATDILSGIRISDVYRTLAGAGIRPAGSNKYRAHAAWRDGDGWSVSLDDARGLWKDFVSDEGGGILDLVVKLRGGSRQDALRWAAEFAGVGLDDRPLTTEERSSFAETRKRIERDLPMARHWKRAALNMYEESLTLAKASFFNPEPGTERSDPAELVTLTNALDQLQRMDDLSLVNEFRDWSLRVPRLTELMVRTAIAHEQAERRALLNYLDRCDREATT